MKNNNDLPNLIRQLETLNRDLQDRPRQAKQMEKDLQYLYDDLCAAYLNAKPEQRADVHIALDIRGRLLEPLLAYFKTVSSQALKTAHRKKQEHAAHQLIQQAAAANVLIGQRFPEEELAAATQQLHEAAAATHFDLREFADSLEVSYKFFMQRALQYHRGHDRIRALKALGLALQANPDLDRDDRVQALAATLTGESEMSAMITVSDNYLLRKFVQELEEAELLRRAKSEPKPRSTMEIIRSWFTN